MMIRRTMGILLLLLVHLAAIGAQGDAESANIIAHEGSEDATKAGPGAQGDAESENIIAHEGSEDATKAGPGAQGDAESENIIAHEGSKDATKAGPGAQGDAESENIIAHEGSEDATVAGPESEIVGDAPAKEAPAGGGAEIETVSEGTEGTNVHEGSEGATEEGSKGATEAGPETEIVGDASAKEEPEKEAASKEVPPGTGPQPDTASEGAEGTNVHQGSEGATEEGSKGAAEAGNESEIVGDASAKEVPPGTGPEPETASEGAEGTNVHEGSEGATEEGSKGATEAGHVSEIVDSGEDVEDETLQSTPPTAIDSNNPNDPNTPGTNPSPPTEPSTTSDIMDLMTYLPEYNGGDPYVSPGDTHRPGSRHVKAHDGFHSLNTERYWAHWNDRFTTDNDFLQ